MYMIEYTGLGFLVHVPSQPKVKDQCAMKVFVVHLLVESSQPLLKTRMKETQKEKRMKEKTEKIHNHCQLTSQKRKGKNQVSKHQEESLEEKQETR